MPEKFPSCAVSYIYGLVDPRDGVVRYIGQSISPKYRYKHHLYSLKKGYGAYKINWINKLKKANQKPILKVLHCFSKEDINWKEAYYINLYQELLKNIDSKLTNSDFGLQSVSKQTAESQKKASLSKNGSIGVKKKKDSDLWEVYISIDSVRYFCGNFKNKRVAQKIYDGVTRNYHELPVTNFEGTFKFTVERAQELSNQFSRRRNNWTTYPGFYKQSTGKWDVNIKVKGKWTRLGRTEDLELGLLIRDRVAKELNIDTLKYSSDSIEPLSVNEANSILTGRKRKYLGITQTKYAYVVATFLDGKNRTIGSTKNLEKAVYIYDCVANYYNKKSNNTTTDKLSLENAKMKMKLD